MKLSWAMSALSLIGALAGASPARAQEAESRPMLLTLDLGTYFVLIRLGLGFNI
jgi:hypothetical protein